MFSLHLELVRWVFALVFGLISVDPLGLDFMPDLSWPIRTHFDGYFLWISGPVGLGLPEPISVGIGLGFQVQFGQPVKACFGGYLL